MRCRRQPDAHDAGRDVRLALSVGPAAGDEEQPGVWDAVRRGGRNELHPSYERRETSAVAAQDYRLSSTFVSGSKEYKQGVSMNCFLLSRVSFEKWVRIRKETRTSSDRLGQLQELNPPHL